MRVLVTGATGFIGQVLCRRLLTEAMHIRASVRATILAASLPIGVEIVPIESIGPETDWSHALADVDAVVHLAARVHVMNDKTADPLMAYRQVNVAGTRRLAQMAAAAGVKRLIFLSSIKVNGEESSIRYSEEDIPSLKDPYGISKWEAEEVLRKIASETSIEVVILRPPLVYGPRVKANFLELLKFIERNIPLPLASIQNRRSFIYLDNLIDAIVTCITHPKAGGKTFLVSDDEDVSTPELIKRIASALGCSAHIFPFSPRLLRFGGKLIGKSAAVERLLGSLTVDSTKIRRELCWNPPYTMDEGLKDTAEWFKKVLSFKR